MVKLEYIHKKIKQDGWKFWKVVNSEDQGIEVQYRDITPDESLQLFNEWYNSMEGGSFAIIMWQKSPRTTSGTFKPQVPSCRFDFRILPQIEKKEETINPMQTLSGFENLGGPFSASALYLENKELKKEIQDHLNTIQDLKTQIRIKDIQDQHASKIAEKDNAWEERIMAIASTVTPDLLKSFQSKPINGIEEQPMTQTPNDAKSRILAAVNKLIEKDPNFTDNIEKLAKLAEKNPAMYQQAAKLINSFI